jgi:hypothetical protein
VYALCKSLIFQNILILKNKIYFSTMKIRF